MNSSVLFILLQMSLSHSFFQYVLFIFAFIYFLAHFFYSFFFLQIIYPIFFYHLLLALCKVKLGVVFLPQFISLLWLLLTRFTVMFVWQQIAQLLFALVLFLCQRFFLLHFFLPTFFSLINGKIMQLYCCYHLFFDCTCYCLDFLSYLFSIVWVSHFLIVFMPLYPWLCFVSYLQLSVCQVYYYLYLCSIYVVIRIMSV